MRKFLTIALVDGVVHVTGPDEADSPQNVIDRVGEGMDEDHSLILVELPGDEQYDVFTDDDGHTTVILRGITGVRHPLDVAGVERDAQGRVIDAPPGSMDAASTGMQHDASGTVTNTVSPEPTPSRVAMEQSE